MLPLGPLERRVLESLWKDNRPAGVREIRDRHFPQTPYTTLMTTLDRLYRKNILDRTKVGRAFFYTPRLTPTELESVMATEALRHALNRDVPTFQPLLAALIKIIGDRDRRLLDELEILVRAQRATS
jgi:predicted transcriptional regulator